MTERLPEGFSTHSRVDRQRELSRRGQVICAECQGRADAVKQCLSRNQVPGAFADTEGKRARRVCASEGIQADALWRSGLANNGGGTLPPQSTVGTEEDRPLGATELIYQALDKEKAMQRRRELDAHKLNKTGPYSE